MGAVIVDAPERNRTSTPGSGGLCDIHFTTGAFAKTRRVSYPPDGVHLSGQMIPDGYDSRVRIA